MPKHFSHFTDNRLLERLEKQFGIDIGVVEDGAFDNVIINYI